MKALGTKSKMRHIAHNPTSLLFRELNRVILNKKNKKQ